MSFDVNRIAALAYLELNQEEQKIFATSMDEIVHFVESIISLDLRDHQISVSSYDMPCVLREDIEERSFIQKELIENFPQSEDSYILVPEVIKK